MTGRALSSNVSLSWNGEILGQSMDSRAKTVTMQQLSNKCSVSLHHIHYPTLPWFEISLQSLKSDESDVLKHLR